MANLIILEDCLDAITKVWIEGYRGNPSWSSSYRGPALQTGLARICETSIRGHDSGCGGSAWVITDSLSSYLRYQSQFDVMCQDVEGRVNSDQQAFGHSEFLSNLVFRVEGEGSTARFSGNVYEAPQISSRMRLYDWTSNSTVLTGIGESVPLVNTHIYRMTLHTKMSGFNDPMEIVNDFAFENAAITISTDQPLLCCSANDGPDQTQVPSPPVLNKA
jgi:hypothetical protein